MSSPAPAPAAYAAPSITTGVCARSRAASTDVITSAHAPSTSMVQSGTRNGSATYGAARCASTECGARQVRALVLLRPLALRDRDVREVLFGLAGLDEEATRPQRDVVHVRGEPERVPEVGGGPGRAVGADARAAAPVERAVHDDGARQPEVHRHRRLGHEVARRLAAEVEVEQPVAPRHAHRGGDGLRGHRVLEEPEAPDAVDVLRGEPGVFDGPSARLGRERQHAAPRCLGELRVPDADDRGVAEELRA